MEFLQRSTMLDYLELDIREFMYVLHGRSAIY